MQVILKVSVLVDRCFNVRANTKEFPITLGLSLYPSRKACKEYITISGDYISERLVSTAYQFVLNVN